MIVLGCGGRTFHDQEQVDGVLDRLHVAHGPITRVVEGGASGADTLVAGWARRHNVPLQTYIVDWSTGPGAGPRRNQRMIDDQSAAGLPIDLVVAFPGGAGTADMVARARRHKITVLEFARRIA